MNFYLTTLFFLLPSYISATPVIQSSAAPTEVTLQHLPTSFAAFGDSYSAGIGSGNFLTSTADGQDNACARQDGSYPWQLIPLDPFEFPVTTIANFFSCSGDVLDDIDAQVAKLGGHPVDAVALSISGNDFGFGNVVRACVYPWSLVGVNQQAGCNTAINNAYNAINNQANWDKYQQKVQLIRSTALNPGGQLYITGYAQFFAPPTDTDMCNNIYFLPSVVAALKMTSVNRLRMNDLVVQVNNRIQNDIVHNGGANVHWVAIDAFFEGHRFCEPANNADPVGADNDEVWFNNINTTLAETGTWTPPSTNADAAAWAQWESGLQAGDPSLARGILDPLQQASSFHPKKGAHHATAALLSVAFYQTGPSAAVTIGPKQFCMSFGPGETNTCWEVPSGCALRNPIDNTVPTIACSNGTSYQP